MSQVRAQGARNELSSADQAAVLLDRVVRNFVAEPNAVEVGIEPLGEKIQLTLHLAPQDLQSITLSQRTLSSLQCIVASLGRRSGTEFVLDCREAGRTI